MTAAEKMLGPDGPFSRRLHHYHPRPAQIEMCDAVIETLGDGGTLIVEAATGIGKTFAYLVPALTTESKVLLSTGTRNLQDQLYRKDLPLVTETLGIKKQTALLKGRSNYLCLYRFERAEEQRALFDTEAGRQMGTLASWRRRTTSGDLDTLQFGLDAALRPMVTSTPDNCLGSDCGHFDQCFVFEARRRAQDADVVVINHHLFLADLALKEQAFGSILPETDAIVFDEAHTLPDIATRFFGQRISMRQLSGLARDIKEETLAEGGDLVQLIDGSRALEDAASAFRLALNRLPEGQRPWETLQRNPEVVAGMQQLRDALEELTPWLEHAAQRSKGLDNCFQRCTTYRTLLSRFSEEPDGDTVLWAECDSPATALNITPLEIGEAFSDRLSESGSAWIFTSATLTVESNFDHFQNRLRLPNARTLQFDSPFDYPRNALLYIPTGLPEPKDPDFVESLIDSALPVLQASGGQAFLLFTSYLSLNRAHERLRERSSFPLLVQGDGPRHLLLEQFREGGGKLLLGTTSFWQGIDVQGSALRCVIIEKLPFASPGDPVLSARIRHMKQNGEDPFTLLQVPEAVIALKQGAGRLIRGDDDQGLLMLCDRRIVDRGYGKRFLNSLPPFPLTRSEAEAIRFLESISSDEPMVCTTT